MSQILALPLLSVNVQTRNTEDWLDSFFFGTADNAIAYPKASNEGTAAITGLGVTGNTPIGDSTVEIVSVEPVAGTIMFSVQDPRGTTIGIGSVGVPFASSQFQFTVTPQGSRPLVVGDAFTLVVLPKPIDLTGIDFILEARLQNAPAAPPILVGKSRNSATLVNGTITGSISTNFSWHVMEKVAIGGYPFDVNAVDRVIDISRTVISGTLTVVQGYANPGDA